MEQKKQYCTPQSTYFDLEEDECILQGSTDSLSTATAESPDFGNFDDDSKAKSINFIEPVNFNDNPY